MSNLLKTKSLASLLNVATHSIVNSFSNSSSLVNISKKKKSKIIKKKANKNKLGEPKMCTKKSKKIKFKNGCFRFGLNSSSSVNELNNRKFSSSIINEINQQNDMSELSAHQQQQQNAQILPSTPPIVLTGVTSTNAGTTPKLNLPNSSIQIRNNSSSNFFSNQTAPTTGGGGGGGGGGGVLAAQKSQSSLNVTNAPAASSLSGSLLSPTASNPSSASLLTNTANTVAKLNQTNSTNSVAPINNTIIQNAQQQQQQQQPITTNSSSSLTNSSNTNTSSAAATAVATTPPPVSSNHSGYLHKWTNYIKGYQKRWFVLNNGLLSYFRSQAEMAHTCRGTINLCNAIIQSEDSLTFVVTNGGQQTFHLKASNELEKQKWVSVLELAKNKAKQYGYNANSGGVTGGAYIGAAGFSTNQQDSDDEEGSIEAEKNELSNMIRVLQQKLDDLSTSHEFVLKHSSALTKSLTELESIQSKPDESTIKTINERSTVYKITMLAVVNACQEFINLAQLQTRKMHKVLQSERDMRTKLEDMVQEMAKQHASFETQLNKRSKRTTNANVRPSMADENMSNQGASSTGSSAAVASSTTKNSGLKQNDSTNNLANNNNQAILSETDKQSESSDIVGDSAQNINSNTTGNNNNFRPRNVDSESSFSGQNNNYIKEEDSSENYDDNQYANEDEFHDAVEDVTQFSVTLPRQKGILHHRNPSNISKLYLQESDMSSDDEDHQTIKVTMHTNKETSGADSQDSTKQSAVAKTVSSLKAANNNLAVAKKPSSNDLNSLKLLNRPVKQRRKEITPRPNYSLNLWSIMKNCIGKDLSKIPIPVNFSEPLSMLQRITEEMEYSNLLDMAAQCEDQWEQMAIVAAFTVSSFSTTATRTNKPFNPLLGETFECDRLDDYGWRALSEQVSHHPPGFATHVESLKDWNFYQEFTMSSKFRGQYLQIIPLGTSHLEFKRTGHHYTWRKVATFVRNIIVGKLWIDNVGEMDIVNHKTKDVCHLKYFAYSYFSREQPRKVTGIITDSNNIARYVLNGTWTEQMEGAPVLNPQVVTEQTQLNTGTSKVLWRRKYPPTHLESMYNFTELAVQLNEPEPGVAPTDTRVRPDQRLMEEAKWDDANKEKLRLEEKQRAKRKQREMSAASLSNSDSTSNSKNENEEDEEQKVLNQFNNTSNEYEPAWFKRIVDPFTKQLIHVTKNEYWDCKDRQDWKRCPDIY